jgi:hypothetical protein
MCPEFLDFFDPTLEEQVVLLVDQATIRKAERLIESCDLCIQMAQ